MGQDALRTHTQWYLSEMTCHIKLQFPSTDKQQTLGRCIWRQASLSIRPMQDALLPNSIQSTIACNKLDLHNTEDIKVEEGDILYKESDR
jgi:hypothetical protein